MPTPTTLLAARDAPILCTEWRQFRQPNFARLKSLMRGVALLTAATSGTPTKSASTA